MKRKKFFFPEIRIYFFILQFSKRSLIIYIYTLLLSKKYIECIIQRNFFQSLPISQFYVKGCERQMQIFFCPKIERARVWLIYTISSVTGVIYPKKRIFYIEKSMIEKAVHATNI